MYNKKILKVPSNYKLFYLLMKTVTNNAMFSRRFLKRKETEMRECLLAFVHICKYSSKKKASYQLIALYQEVRRRCKRMDGV